MAGCLAELRLVRDLHTVAEYLILIKKQTEEVCMTQKDEPLLSTIDEVARLLRVSPDTVRRMIVDKELDAVKVRGQWRIKKPSVDKLLS
jgi:excisionase family DNA binding protein